MAKKRKLETQQQQQQQQEVKIEEKPEEYEDQEGMEEDEEEEYEEEEEEDDEDDEDSDGGNGADNDQMVKTSSTASAAVYQDADDEPVQNLLEPFSKEQLISLLREAADKHSDVADRIRKVADEDPAHRKIFVHGLGWDTNAETLANAFKQYGEIEDCKAVCDKISGKSKGYGFILFKSRSGAHKALKEPQKKIGSRMTACQLASIGPVAPPAAAAAAPVVPAQLMSEYTQRKIYVSNVSAELDPQKLITFFSKYGEIEDGPLGLDKHTGKPKGFCLFVYKTTESAKKALEEPHKNFEGHILHCQKAIDGPKPSKQNPHHHNNPHNAQFQRNENPSFTGSAAVAGPGHLMAPSAAGLPFNQGAAAAAAQALNPALGQALTALLASQGAGLGLTNLLGTLGTAGVGAAGAGHGIQGAYGNQGMGSSISPAVMGSYGNQGGYPNQQMGQGGSGRSQHGVGHMGGAAPYMGH
uniref:Putative UBP1-associated protein 2A-like n=1 Tax=Davidia involucrata TaxID=16924 RepID=A0A5B7BF22_DAVIN